MGVDPGLRNRESTDWCRVEMERKKPDRVTVRRGECLYETNHKSGVNDGFPAKQNIIFSVTDHSPASTWSRDH